METSTLINNSNIIGINGRVVNELQERRIDNWFWFLFGLHLASGWIIWWTPEREFARIPHACSSGDRLDRVLSCHALRVLPGRLHAPRSPWAHHHFALIPHLTDFLGVVSFVFVFTDLRPLTRKQYNKPRKCWQNIRDVPRIPTGPTKYSSS